MSHPEAAAGSSRGTQRPHIGDTPVRWRRLRRVIASSVITLALGAAAPGVTGAGGAGPMPQVPVHTVIVPGPAGGFPGQELVLTQNCGDPSVTGEPAGGYWLVCTSDRLPAIPLYHSADLLSWQPVSDGLITLANRPAWAVDRFWGPALVEVRGGWRLYFTARGTDGALHIGVASATSPGGPYIAGTAPLLSAPAGVIDPSGFVDTDGAHFLLWKIDGNSRHQPTAIMMQRLSDDGLTVIPGTERQLLASALPSEHGIIEGPVMVQHNGWYYLFYSAGQWGRASYSINVARSRTLDTPFERNPSGPLMTTSPAWLGPGGQTFVVTPGGDRMLWHASGRSHNDGVRQVIAGGVTWTAGWPALTQQSVAAVGQPTSATRTGTTLH